MLFDIVDFNRHFNTESDCLEYLYSIVSPYPKCGKCKRRDSFYRNSRKPCFTCICGKSHIYPRKGTLFENSPLPLKKWFRAIFLVSNKKGKITAADLARKINVSYATAWRIKNEIILINGKKGHCFEDLLEKAANIK